jgi:hypothetical protein
MAGSGISIFLKWGVLRELARGNLVSFAPDDRLDRETALRVVYPKSNVLIANVRV